jgi:hypothetical protein
MSDLYMAEYEKYWVDFFDNGIDEDPPGYITDISVRNIEPERLSVSWYANTRDRFHEIQIEIPVTVFKNCIGCLQYDGKPVVFVDENWLQSLFTRNFSVFTMIDVADFSKYLKSDEFKEDKLIELQSKIDQLAEANNEMLFLSFADNLLIKSNWKFGNFKSPESSPYNADKLIDIVNSISGIYKEVLDSEIYAILTQGYNYHSEELFSANKTGNHIALNSLGSPFADLFSIEAAVRKNIKNEKHAKYRFYFDLTFYRSLLKRDQATPPSYCYKSLLSKSSSKYVCSDEMK